MEILTFVMSKKLRYVRRVIPTTMPTVPKPALNF